MTENELAADDDHDTLGRVVALPQPCPGCGVRALELIQRLEARPIGTWSLAGIQPKVTVRPWPHVRCSVDRGGCGIEARGRFESRSATSAAHRVTSPASEEGDDT